MKMTWRKMVVACAFALTVSPLVAADAMPRSEWHNLVSDCAQNSQAMRDTMSKVSADDQAALLAEVNEAISKMPGSVEVKAAMFYAANSAAVKSAAKGNLAKVLAEVFATVPVEYLTEINERFAKEIFNRNANPSRTFSDDEFVNLSTNTMAVISARCEKAENTGVRETFAALMFLRASNGTPENLAQTLASSFVDSKAREIAVNEWIKPAMGDGQEQTYDPLLGIAQAGEEPDHDVVLRMTGSSDVLVGMLGDLSASTGKDNRAGIGSMTKGIVGTSKSTGFNGLSDIGVSRVPRSFMPKKRDGENNFPDDTPGGGGYTPGPGPRPDPDPGPVEPDPYP